MGNSICSFISQLWHNPSLIRNINSTFLVLIPKKDNPEELRDFRPIGLCNVIFKTLTKIIANRIKPVLNQVIGPTQCSFIPGRHRSDNIIIAQEVVHSMRIKQGNIGFMTIKIDLEKAYDRLNWNFLLQCLEDLNLPYHILEIVASCISSPSMQLLWSGEKTEEFFPSRGIRQGDPLSPYLFVICMERLTHMIQERIDKHLWNPITLCNGGPPLSHLFFADDIILFAEVSLQQAIIIRECLNDFCASSGMKVNNSKTRVYFSKNVNHTR